VFARRRADARAWQVAGTLARPLALSVSHDGALVALAFAPADVHAFPPAHRLGVDVMRVALPRGEALAPFVACFEEQLAAPERTALGVGSGPATIAEGERLDAFFRIWTTKEAYTKALGLGLGFDFARLALDAGVLSADGAPVQGWEMKAAALDVRGARYVCALARCVGGAGGSAGVEEVSADAGWVVREDAEAFVRRAIAALGA
jgi:4'-phosphopantetheinyl transferase